MNFDCIVIGAGSGGAKIAHAFAKRNKQVAVIERDYENYGGACINYACIPSKVLIEDSTKGVPYPEAMERKNYIVKKFRDSKYHSLEQETNVTLIKGEASFVDDHTVAVETDDGTEKLRAEHIVINTGASSAVPDIKGLGEIKHVYTSTTMLDKEVLPEHLLIVGGGYIGLEFATMYVNFGSKVTIINRDDQLIPQEEPEIRDELMKILDNQGVELVLGTEPEQFNQMNGSIQAELTNGKTIQGDTLLFATGRKPNIEALKLENTSIQTEKGAVRVHETIHTTVEHVYAVGDIRGEEQFTYVSSDDGRKVMDDVFGEQEGRLAKPRNHLQYTVFTDPPLSRVGLTEQEAENQGYRIRTKLVPVHTIGRAYIIDDKRGQFKSVVDADTGKILGVSLLGVRSEELINTVKVAMDADWNYKDMRDLMINHPVMSEAFNPLFNV